MRSALFDEGDYVVLACLIAEVRDGTVALAAFAMDGACVLGGSLNSCALGRRIALGPTANRDTIPLELEGIVSRGGSLNVDRADLLYPAIHQRHILAPTRR